ncbi:SIR2 family protein [Chryseobacterium arthrosphaerae]|uniref:SIR2 family protein n=1 Tax=Chryseobacterium arthrosphaerae TaxID=651561 RepID=UPI001E5596CD|nr:SIR2 family protein [Chryseobacterium arthrosphaerae]UEQ75252.1 SIR2 family protein [Chryseobacterium arthrosphaerae]
MIIEEFISHYRNHPVLFIGTGISLRYLKNSYTWDGLLKQICFDFTDSREYYLDIKSQFENNGLFDYTKIASVIEKEFNESLLQDRNGKFKEINDIFYQKMNEGISLSRFKIYISKLFSNLEFKEDKEQELRILKKIRKNIGSIITTNYDGLIEFIFEFDKLIGNNILLSNPYGSVYKIHGCFDNPEKIIITESDYDFFEKRYELIRAQLLSLFIHNPIIFLGYGVGDENIKQILRTIFSYVQPNSQEASQIKRNFLLVEYGENIEEANVVEHDIVLENNLTIQINKVRTDNFSRIYEAISNLNLPVSALDIRKVQNIVKEIYAGGDIKVSITEDLDELRSSDKVLAIGSDKTIKYHYHTSKELLSKYFEIIDEANSQILECIDHYNIQASQYFPVFGFERINPNLNSIMDLKLQQEKNLNSHIAKITDSAKKTHHSINDIFEDVSVAPTHKINCIIWNLSNETVNLDNVEVFLRENINDSTASDFRKLLSAYDYKKYS